MCVSLLGDGAFLVALAWQVYALSDAPTAMALVGIAMTVPTIVFLLVGGVASDRLDRRRVMLAADVVRGLAVGLLALLALTGALELWHIAVLVAVYGAGAAFFAPAFDAIVPELLPAERPRAGQRAGPVRAADRAAPGRPGARRRARRRCSGRARRSRSTRHRSSSPPSRCSPCAAAARRAAPAARVGVARPARGLALRPQPRVAVGDVRQRGDRLPAVHGPGRGAAALLVKNDLRRQRRRPRPRVRRRRPRLGRLRGRARAARAAAARHHVHVPGLDARHAGGRRLRPRRPRSGS